MTLTELTAAIQEYGDFKIEELNPGYKVSIYLGRTECPIVIVSDLSFFVAIFSIKFFLNILKKK